MNNISFSLDTVNNNGLRSKSCDHCYFPVFLNFNVIIFVHVKISHTFTNGVDRLPIITLTSGVGHQREDGGRGRRQELGQR
jgi:hypothetical protein